MIGGEIARLFVTVGAKTEEFERSINDVQTRMRGIGDSATALGGKLTKGVTLPIVAMFAGVGKAAMDLEATEAKYNAVFDGMTETADQFISDFQKLTPATTAEARSMASGIQDMLIPMGFLRDEATDMTSEFMHVSGALANFNSGTHSAADVTNAMTSALAGQYMPLRSLGIQLDKTTIAEKALEMGLIDTKEEMTKQIEAQVMLAEVYAQSEDALSAYTEENLDAKTKMGLMKAELIDVAAALGQQLLPIITQVVEGIRSAVEWFGNLDEGQQRTIMIVAAVVAAIGPLLLIFGALVTAITAIMSPVGLVVLAIMALIAIGVALWKNWDTIKEKAAEIWGGIKDFFAGIWEKIKEIFSVAWEFIKDLFFSMSPLSWFFDDWEAVGEFFSNIWQRIKEIFSGSIGDIFSNIQGVFGDIWEYITGLWDKIKDYFAGIWENIRGIGDGKLGEIFDNIREKYEAVRDFILMIWEGIKTFFINIWEAIKAVFRGDLEAASKHLQANYDGIFKFIENIWGKILGFFKRIWDNIKSAVSERANALRDTVIKTVDDAMQFIRDLPAQALQWGKDIIRGMIDGIKSMAGAAADAVKGTVGGVIDGAKGILGIKSPSKVFQEIGINMGEGLKAGMEQARSLVTAPMQNLVAVPGAAMAAGGNADGSYTIIVELDGRQIAKATGKHLTREIRVKQGMNQ